ncbi:ABC transporter, ATP-binding protein [Lachnospiraceae bacterium KM106-2]|nr:ABC transporter, ATP-binding protein [Lachnospiraceae bacterium KM106-2]
MLRVEHLEKKFKDFAIRDISFQLEPGYIMGLIGRNGAGKTTLMRMLLGVYKIDRGSVSINGWDLVHNTVKAKDEIGFILDQTPFLEELTIAENQKLFSRFYSRWDDELFDFYLRRFHISEHRLVMDLSKGIQTKLQLAFALAHHPRLLIMDEPTGGLDPIFRKEFLMLLQELLEKEEMSILISTHLTNDLDQIADYITMIDDGKLLFSKSKEELLDECYIVKGAIEDEKALLGDANAIIVHKKGRFEAFIQDRELADKLLAITEIPVVLEHATLEDIMYYRTRRGLDEN